MMQSADDEQTEGATIPLITGGIVQCRENEKGERAEGGGAYALPKLHTGY